MNFEVLTTKLFERKLKPLAKKYHSIADDLESLEKELKQNPTLGTPLGKDCYKIRMAIASKGQGKSGGARIITYIRVLKNTVKVPPSFYEFLQDAKAICYLSVPLAYCI